MPSKPAMRAAERISNEALGTHWGPAMLECISEIIDAESPVKVLVDALTKIRDTHQAYYDPANGEGQYGIGVTDGHRCAAQIARAALAKFREGK